MSSQHRWAEVVRSSQRSLSGAERDRWLHEALSLAPDAAPSIVGCSVTERRDEQFVTRAAWQDVSLALDDAQYRCDVGPSLQAARSGRIQHVDDMGREQRFQHFRAAALVLGVRSSFSVPVAKAGHAAVNLYAAQAHAFDPPRHRAVASLLARCVGRLLDDPTDEGTQFDTLADPELDAARLRSAQVRAAVKLLMARDALSYDAAFAELTLRSRLRQRTVFDLARETVADFEAAEGSA